MNTAISKAVSMGVFFLVIYLSGFWLSRSGKPYPIILITAHKLIALGVLIFLISTAVRLNQAAPLSPAQIAAIVVTVIFFAGTIVTGGLVSIEKPMPSMISSLHSLLPYLALLSTGASLFLLLSPKPQVLGF